MGNPVIIDAVRTPLGKRNGWLAGVHPGELLGFVQARGARPRRASTRSWSSRWSAAASPRPASSPTTWSAAPGCTPGSPSPPARTTIDAQCGSGQQAAHLVNDMIAAGTIDVGIACGVESMSPDPARRQRPARRRRPAAGRLDDRHAQPVRGRRPDRPQPRPDPRGPRRVRPRLAAEGPGRGRRGPVRARDRAARGAGDRRGAASRPARPASSTPTRGCATPPSRGWPGCSRCCPTACTRPARRRRSATAPPPC